jgi:REP element-mobilizing transposase RayT
MMIFEQFSRRKRNFKGHSFWARGYYVTTVGLYEAKVRSLIYGFYSNVARGKREKNEQD